MKNSMVLLALSLALTWPVPCQAEQDPLQKGQLAMAHIPGYPLMTLPGMRTLPRTESLSGEALPRPLITDVINIPNPFDSRKAGLEGQTQIAYHLDKDIPVTVTLYDLMGLRVRRWQFGSGQNGGREGSNHFLWDGTNENGQKVSKGGYLAQIEIAVPETSISVIRKIGVIH